MPIRFERKLGVLILLMGKQSQERILLLKHNEASAETTELMCYLLTKLVKLLRQ